jgi:hypothetical protein
MHTLDKNNDFGLANLEKSYQIYLLLTLGITLGNVFDHHFVYLIRITLYSMLNY